MGKKSRRKRTDKWAHIDTREADAAKRDALDFLKGYAFKEEEGEARPWICAATHERRRRRAVIAAAEAEFRAAIAAVPPRDDNEEVKIYEDARCIQALAALTRQVTIDEDDKKTMGEYLTKSAAGDGIGNEELIKLVKRWPRVRKYWPRLRRRLCWGCGKQYDLSEPRLWVCSGCEDARYCDETCQREHWRAHKGECLQTWHGKAQERQSRGESDWAELQQEFYELYPSRDG
ncbi:unnamed protein product [Pelagomonas calceolata]|uniref:MYND-type domain-containing protein n=1 Tax=Pelagomonas calceolata TaxID=35677 RepID=A0A8J2WPG5_9STRA|nr:unnamed protein product [Pelagomonas calceolata]